MQFDNGSVAQNLAFTFCSSLPPFLPPSLPPPSIHQATGVMEMRQALEEKEEQKSLKQKTRERVRLKIYAIVHCYFISSSFPPHHTHILHTHVQSHKRPRTLIYQVRPKMGKLTIDYQKLHDAFFKYVHESTNMII